MYTSNTYDEPIVAVGEHSNDFVLLDEYVYEWLFEGKWRRIRIEAGFRFDGASIPWIVQPLTGGKWGLGKAPPLIHDLLYRCGGQLELSSHGHYEMWDEEENRWRRIVGKWTREDVDRLFGRMMKEAGVPKRRRDWAYRAVKWFGEDSWKDPHAAAR